MRGNDLELFMARRGWRMVSNDLWVLLLGIQDATLMARTWSSRQRAWGWQAAFWEAHRTGRTKSSKSTNCPISKAMAVMDEGYLAQDYYRKLKAKIPLEGDRRETFTYKDYSWTEHISRKWGQWNSSLDELLEQLAKCGFHISSIAEKK
jgi:hypothetical protein